MSGINVVFMGSENFSLPIVRSLAGDEAGVGGHLVAVVTQPDRPAGRGRKVTQNPVKGFALERSVSVLQPERLRDQTAVSAILAMNPDLIVVASYGQIVPRVLLDAPQYGSLNLHPSLLPKYRGASPVTGPILAGDEQTGATLMLMRPKMDAGPILAQEPTPIGEDETAGELEARLALLSAHLLTRCLEPWLRGDVQPVEQVEEEATYTARLDKSDGLIDWSEPAALIVRRVRAFNPWPTAFTYWSGRMVKILRAHVASGEREPGRVSAGAGEVMSIGTGQGLLVVDELQLAGGRPLSASEVLSGHESLRSALLGGLD